MGGSVTSPPPSLAHVHTCRGPDCLTLSHTWIIQSPLIVPPVLTLFSVLLQATTYHPTWRLRGYASTAIANLHGSWGRGGTAAIRPAHGGWRVPLTAAVHSAVHTTAAVHPCPGINVHGSCRWWRNPGSSGGGHVPGPPSALCHGGDRFRSPRLHGRRLLSAADAGASGDDDGWRVRATHRPPFSTAVRGNAVSASCRPPFSTDLWGDAAAAAAAASACAAASRCFRWPGAEPMGRRRASTPASPAPATTAAAVQRAGCVWPLVYMRYNKGQLCVHT